MAPIMIISPSFLCADPLQYGREIEMTEKSGADWIHVDVMDGHYVPNMALGANFVRAMKPATKLPIDVHLMVERVDEIVPLFIDAGADHITIHADQCHHPHKTLSHIQNHNCKSGIAVNPGANLENIYPLLGLCDIILVMGVNPGFAGQKFIPDQLQTIQILKQYIQKKGLSCMIQVDGGVNKETGKNIIESGADALVLGNCFFGKTGGLSSNAYAETVQYFKNI